jgi:hypothetical protein
LGKCCNIPVYSQLGQKCIYLRCAHTLWVFFVVEKYVLFDPNQISPFSFIGILFQSNGIADSIEEFFGFCVHRYGYNQFGIIYYSTIYIRYFTYLNIAIYYGAYYTGYTRYITSLYGVDNIHIMPNICLYTVSKWRYYIKNFAYQPVMFCILAGCIVVNYSEID